MLFWFSLSLLLLSLVLFYKLVFLFFDKHNDIKKAFGLPFYYNVINHDLGENPKPYYVWYKNLVGTPDVLFKLCILPYWIVGEAKSRSIASSTKQNKYPLLLREEYQMMLYLGIIKRKYPYSIVTGVFKFKDQTYPLKYKNKEFRHIYKHKNEAIRAKKCLR